MKILTKKRSLFLGVLVLLVALFATTYPSFAETELNLIPTMTSNTSPNGYVASASTQHLPWNPAWHAFDNNPATWWAANDTYEGWLAIELPTPTVVTKYGFFGIEDGTSLGDVVPPTIFNFEGYDEENVEWDVLSEHIKGDWPSWVGRGEYVEYEINNVKAYKKYRVRTTDTAFGYHYGHLAIDNLQLFSDDITSSINGRDASYSQGFEFSTPQIVKKVNFNLNNITDASLPISYTIEGKDETTGEWETINTDQTSIIFGSNVLNLNNTNAYKKYRLNLHFNSVSPVSLTISSVFGS